MSKEPIVFNNNKEKARAVLKDTVNKYEKMIDELGADWDDFALNLDIEKFGCKIKISMDVKV